MAKRRGKKEGTIFKRKNGTWRAQVRIGGERLSYTGQTQTECREWVRETQRRLKAGLTFEGSKLTYGEYLTTWLSTMRATLRPRTWRQYSQIVRDYIAPNLSQIKLVELRPDLIQNLFDRMIKSGKGRRTVQLVHAVIRRSLNQAVKLGLLGQNPASVTTPPKPKKREMKILDQSQVHQLILAAGARGFRHLALYHVALATGMRQSELLGLKWDDVDLTAKTLRVERQVKSVPGGGFEFTPPKTNAGRRTIRIGEETADVLKHHYETQLAESAQVGIRWQDHGLMFPSTVGTPQKPSNLMRSFRLLLKDSGLPRIRFHDLRHTAASLMLNNGIDVLIVARRLGHAKPSITLDIYGHVISESQQKAADLVDKLITPIAIDVSKPMAPDWHQARISTISHPPTSG